ncbi:hypothetical protein GCM10023091_20650 [Ravibacter arvi]|uniref:Uncharacterized protein n=2 Tax=Ravibacter arvi TaxID=2051041 RepID=A0ABP8LZY0_9BACT
MAIFDYHLDYFKEAKDRFLGFYNRGTQWGSYTVEGDTIRMLVVESPGNTSWLSDEYTFKIENKESIRLVSVSSPDYAENGALNYLTNGTHISEAGRFYPSDTLPDPDKSWLKHRKWYWCDKDQYKTWKKEYKKREK